MLRVGLTGGIGSGKTEVTRRLAERGAEIIDADLLAREVVAPGTPGLASIVDAFGSEVLAPDGTLDREYLAHLVFHDPARRKRLEDIVHPLVRAETAHRMAAAPPDSIVINDVPLLVETHRVPLYEVVIVVAASPQTQLDRLVRLRGMTPEDAQARIDAQIPLADKVSVATYVIENDGDLAALEPQVNQLWRELRQLAAGQC
ncbi:MAG: dephospho-CoA kinase [Frankiaceae bacterium]